VTPEPAISNSTARNQTHIAIVVFAAMTALASLAFANGIRTDGVGARAMSLGGADVAWADDPLGALGANPAGLSALRRPEMDAGFVMGLPTGSFKNRVDDDGHLAQRAEFGPEFAIGLPVGSTPLALGIGIVPEAGLSAHWRYDDPPGGLGGKASYGSQANNSAIRVLRSAVAMSVQLSRTVSVGASLGFDYNENELHTPYVFQTQPALRGGKVLLRLETNGWGVNGSAGVMFRPRDDLQFGLSYESSTGVRSHGGASGNAGAQLKSLGGPYALARRDFHYDAEVDTKFPQIVSGGMSWKFHRGWRLALQVDWIDWSGAFDTLPVKLRHGNNADLNGVAGADHLQDNIPLRWRDSFVYRAGLEYALTENFSLRCGYAYGRSPVPDGTLTPLTAVIPEHTLSLGAGYSRGRFRLDLAYQWSLPATRHVGERALLSGEYSDSTTRVGIQWVGLTTSVAY
jgi:long-chain fatty acid transport protein